MLSYDTAQLHLFSVLTEKVHHLFAAHPEYAAGHHRLDRSLSWTTVEAVGIVASKLTLEREPCDMLPIVADAIRYILEAPFGDEAEPPCGVALTLQLVALTVSHLLALALAKLAQRLNINTIFSEFLFHRQFAPLSYNICRAPFFWHFVTFCAVCYYIGHDSITETAFVLIHEDRLAAVVNEIVFQVATEVRGWKINLDALLWVLLLNELQRRYKVTVGTDKYNGVSSIKYAVGNHTHGDIHIGFLFLRP